MIRWVSPVLLPGRTVPVSGCPLLHRDRSAICRSGPADNFRHRRHGPYSPHPEGSVWWLRRLGIGSTYPHLKGFGQAPGLSTHSPGRFEPGL